MLIILKRCPEQRLRTSGYMLSKARASMRPPRCSTQLAIGEQVRAVSTHLDRAPVHSRGVIRIVKLRQCCERLEVWAGIVVQLLLCTHHWLTACPDCPLRRVKSTSKDHTMHVARRCHAMFGSAMLQSGVCIQEKHIHATASETYFHLACPLGNPACHCCHCWQGASQSLHVEHFNMRDWKLECPSMYAPGNKWACGRHVCHFRPNDIRRAIDLHNCHGATAVYCGQTLQFQQIRRRGVATVEPCWLL